MRVKICQIWKTGKLEVVAADERVVVSGPWGVFAHHELRWTWFDGREYRLLSPVGNPGQKREWLIQVDGETACVGQETGPVFVILHRDFQWECGSTRINHLGTCYCGIHRLATTDGKRLVAWRSRGFFMRMECVIRGEPSSSMTSLLVGMILGTWPASS